MDDRVGLRDVFATAVALAAPRRQPECVDAGLIKNGGGAEAPSDEEGRVDHACILYRYLQLEVRAIWISVAFYVWSCGRVGVPAPINHLVIHRHVAGKTRVT